METNQILDLSKYITVTRNPSQQNEDIRPHRMNYFLPNREISLGNPAHDPRIFYHINNINEILKDYKGLQISPIFTSNEIPYNKPAYFYTLKEELTMKQIDVAEKIGLPPSTLSKKMATQKNTTLAEEHLQVPKSDRCRAESSKNPTTTITTKRNL